MYYKNKTKDNSHPIIYTICVAIKMLLGIIIQGFYSSGTNIIYFGQYWNRSIRRTICITIISKQMGLPTQFQ